MDWLPALPPDNTMLCSVNQGGEPGPNYISPGQVALGAIVVLVNALVSIWLNLDMHWQLAIGVIRWTPHHDDPFGTYDLALYNVLLVYETVA